MRLSINRPSFGTEAVRQDADVQNLTTKHGGAQFWTLSFITVSVSFTVPVYGISQFTALISHPIDNGRVIWDPVRDLTPCFHYSTSQSTASSVLRYSKILTCRFYLSWQLSKDNYSELSLSSSWVSISDPNQTTKQNIIVTAIDLFQ